MADENEGEESGARRGCVEVEEVSRTEVEVEVEMDEGSSASRVVVLEMEGSLRL